MRTRYDLKTDGFVLAIYVRNFTAIEKKVSYAMLLHPL